MKYIFSLFLFLLFAFSAMAQTVTLTATYSGSTNGTNIIAGDMDSIGDGLSRAFMKFDLSALASNAVITNATLEYYNYGGLGSSSISNSIFALSYNPNTAAAATLYADCGDASPLTGNVASITWLQTIPSLYFTTLNALGNSFLNANIGGSASLALARDAGGTNTYNFRGYTNATNPPKLTLTYYLLTPCSATPAAGTATASNPFPCTGESVILSLKGTTAATGLAYQWQIDSNGTSTWLNISGAIYNTYTFSSTTNHSYRCIVQCVSISSSSASDSARITVGGIFNFPYAENFETTNGGWSGVDIAGGKQEWLWGPPTKTKTNGTVNGLNCWATNLVSDYTDLSDYALVSPCFNFTSVPYPRMSFSMRYLTEVDYDGLFLETSTNGGTTWTKVPAANIIGNTYNSTSTIAVFTPPAWCGDNGGWLRYVVSLPNLGGVAAAKIRVRFQSDNFVTDEGVAFDSVYITNTFKDLTMTSLLAPVNACSPLGLAVVKINITNYGLTLASGTKIPVSYSVNNGTVSNDTITLTKNKIIGDTIQFSFKTLASITAFGTYSFKLSVNLPGDSDRKNDTLIALVSILSVNVLPYSEGFETIDGGWSSKLVAGTSNDFVWGTPYKTFLSGAASGSKCWVTRTFGDYDDNSDFALESPCINLSGATYPSLAFSLKFSTEPDYDGCILESSINGGLSWLKVSGFTQGGYNNTSTFGVFSPPQWSGTSAGWIRVKVPLTGFSGLSNVKFRIRFASDFSTTDEGVAVDSMAITDIYSKDVGVTGIISPRGGCGMSTTTPLTVKIKNYGKPLPIGTKIPVSYRMVDFNNIYLSSATDTLLLTSLFKLNDSLNFTFNSTLNLATPGYYIIKVWTALLNDSDQLNDTLFSSPILSRSSISTFPYTQDFEISEGTWYGEALNGTTINEWDWNFPMKTAISNTPNGQQCWLTNPFNNYANNTHSALYSPCFNLSALTNPELSFLLRFKMQANTDAMVLERSINGGASWQRVDSSNTQGTYNNTSTTGGITPPKWSGDNLVWKSYTVNLASLAAQSNVQFRFRFKSDATVNDEGAAIDSVVLRDNIFNDLSLTGITAPISKCGLTATETVSVDIKNLGNVVLPAGTSIALSYILNNGTPVNENFSLPADLAVNGVANYNFTTTANLSLGGLYTFKFYCYFWADINAANDTINNYQVTTKSVISTFPYLESFALNTPNWTATVGGNQQWRITNKLINPILAAHSGSYMAVFSADSFLANTTSRLNSPCFDFSSLNSNSTLSFYLTSNNFNPLNPDSLYVLISSNDGVSWTTLGALTRYNMAYSTPQWGRVDLDLSAFAGQTKILLAFEARGKRGTAFAIDDIQIYNTVLRSSSGIFSAVAPCPIASGNQWVDLRDDQNNLIAQLNPNGNNLGSLCFGVNIVTNTLRSERLGVHPNKKDNYYFVRNLWLQSAMTPTTPIGIRLYYAPSDFGVMLDSVKNRTGTTLTKTDLQVLNYANATFADDLDVLNNDYSTGTSTYYTPTDNVLNGFNYFGFATSKLGEQNVVYSRQVTGVKQAGEAFKIEVFPNPAHTKLTLSAALTFPHTCYTIYNAIGQPMMYGELLEPSTALNISALTNGVYLIRIGNEMRKFVKE